jgi:hypothetical protein
MKQSDIDIDEALDLAAAEADFDDQFEELIKHL